MFSVASSSDTILIAALAGIIVAMALGRIERRLRARAGCARAAARGAHAFFEKADFVLSNDKTPAAAREMMLTLVRVIRNPDMGRVVLGRFLDEAPKAVERSGKLDDEISRFQTEQPALYEAWMDALRDAFDVLVLAYGPEHTRVELKVLPTSPVLYELAKKVTNQLTGQINGFGGAAHA